MQKRIFSRLIVLLSALILCISLCTGTAFASETEQTAPTFVLCFDTGDGVQYYSAFCVRSGDNVYLVSAAEAGSLAQTGCDTILAGIGYSEKAELLKTVGQVSYFRAPGLENAAVLEMGTEFPETVVLAMVQEEEGERYVTVTDPISVSEGWQNMGSYYLSEELMLEDSYLVGAPVLSADATQVVGVVSRTNDLTMVLLPLIGNVFPEDATVLSVPAAPVPEATGEAADQETTDEAPEEGADGEKKISPQNLILIGGGLVILIGIIVAANRKPKKKGSGSVTGAAPGAQSFNQYPQNGNTIPLKRNEMVSELVDIQPTMPLNRGFSPTAPLAVAKWQLRCVRGPMEGKVYPLTDKLSFGRMQDNDVAFPEDTKGVSARHCEVQVLNGRVSLQDLNSTYGTYFGNEQRAKLRPNMEYPLKDGDVFILAEGGPAFTLEAVGGSQKKTGFAVRSTSGTIYRSNADGEITFGRNPECVAAFDQSSTTISGKHCKLFRGEDGLFLMDQGSTNGTFFAGNQRLKPNVSYKVEKGTSFYLFNSQNTFVITEE